MFDIFYKGTPPDLFPFEKPADTLEDAAEKSRTGYFWYIDSSNDYKDFNFEYRAVPWEQEFIHVWPSQWQRDSGTYLANKATVDQKHWHFKSNVVTRINTPDIFFIDKHNSSAKQQYDTLVERLPNIQRIRYVGTMLDTVKRCANKSTTENFWIITSEFDYSLFDFTWHPDQWQTTLTHVFGSQWQQWSDTFYINRIEFLKQVEWANALEALPNLNFITDQTVQSIADYREIYFVDHGNEYKDLDKLKLKFPNLRVTRFIDSYQGTLKRIVNTSMIDYVWVLSSLCDYSSFDFTWYPSQWQRNMLHVFASDDQPKGDTFYINTEHFKKQIDQLEILDWYDTINYCTDQTVPRLPLPVHSYDSDNLIKEIQNYNFKYPYALFTNQESTECPTDYCLWREKDRTLITLTPSGAVSLVPRDIKTYLDTQIYDYPHIFKQKQQVSGEKNMDVIFISNGEPMALDNWKNLLSICPRAKHSQGVTGREAAYKAAAKLSSTPWFFAVFAKTEVLSTFDFSFQPDYLQEPKHYIFHSRNPLNGLEYGAMNINLYNKQLVLDTVPGIDFTLSAAHAVIPICASISRFNTDPWITWRSAFREVLKLRQEVEQGADVEIQHRLNVWMSEAKGENAEYCLRGAQDADQYYTKVNGDADKLKLSFDWAWLQDYYYSLYNSKPWLESV